MNWEGKLKTLILILAVLAFGTIIWAQDSDTQPVRPSETDLLFDEAPEDVPGEQSPEANELPGVGFGDFLRVILVLALVILLIYAFVWMLKKFTAVKAEGTDAIRLFSTRPLKGDAALHLVEAGNRIFLIASSSNSVNLISEIDDKESIDEIRLNASRTPQPISGGFARLFKDRFGSGSSDQIQENKLSDDPASFIRKQKERLKDL